MGTQDPDRFWAEVCPPLRGTTAAWCGGFALWALREAGLTQGHWVIGRGFIMDPKTGNARLPRTTDPKPGDIAYFNHLQHHAIVESVSPSGALMTIDGNQKGETVRRRARTLRDATAFFSIAPLLEGRDVLADDIA